MMETQLQAMDSVTSCPDNITKKRQKLMALGMDHTDTLTPLASGESSTIMLARTASFIGRTTDTWVSAQIHTIRDPIK